MATKMTQDEFITGYLNRSGLLGNVRRTSNGWQLGARRYWAIRCGCGEKCCEGWATIGAEQLSHHMAFNAPEGEPWPDGALDAYRAAWGDDAHNV